jgi:hypothetical protein
MTYQPDFDHDFRRGQIGENLVESFLKALEGCTIETKTDSRVPETGNVYIETWQWRDHESNAKQSGINTTKADYWCIAAPQGNGFVMITTEALKQVIKETNPPEGKQTITNEKTMASKGRLVKMSDILRKIGLGK